VESPPRHINNESSLTNRGFANDDEGTENERTAAKKAHHLELMLGQIANFCPVIADKYIISESTSISSVWQAIRLHFGFQVTGGRFLDLADLHLEPEERNEDLYQRIVAFVDDSLLKQGGLIKHHDEEITEDEQISPTLENFLVYIG